MAEFNEYLLRLLKAKSIDVSGKDRTIIEEFVTDEDNVFTFNQVLSNQNILIDRFMSKLKVYDIVNQHLQIPNGTVKKEYVCKIDIAKLGKGDILATRIEGLEPHGLLYDQAAGTISGIPAQSGDFKINFEFKMKGEDETTPYHSKPISLIINADPKSLWKNIPSDEGKDEAWKEKNYWKPDVVCDSHALGNRHIVVASTRGRSHANVGSFRDDDFAFKHFDKTGWSIICVADGAGSAKFSRKGSELACNAVIEYFEERFTADHLNEFETIVTDHYNKTGEDTAKKISHFVYNNLSKAAVFAHRRIEEFATKLETPIKDFHSTLIFALLKKYDFGYALLTFGVGDCPIGVINKDLTDKALMNWLDVGEFGGGTRFITMPEIFSSDKFTTRFGFKLIDDFSYLVLMTDGIYDPKFVVEANLEKLEAWKEFMADLQGNNAENIKVEFNPKNKDIAHQLSSWMDFWSPGNHDDRTLAIVF